MTTEITEPVGRAALYRKIAAVAGAAPTVKPTGYNNDIKKKYADIDDITALLKPLLAEQQLAVILHLNSTTQRETGQKTGSGAPFIVTAIECTFIIADGETGETLALPWGAEAADHMKDKGLPKALTIARRTFLIHTFGIIAEEEKQLWGSDEQQAQPQRPQPARPATTQAPNGASKKPPTRDGMITRIADLTAEADALKLRIALKKPLDEMSDQELIAHGQSLGAQIAKAKAQADMDECFPEKVPAPKHNGMPEAELPL